MLSVQGESSWWIDTTLLAGSQFARNVRGSALSRGDKMRLNDDGDAAGSDGLYASSETIAAMAIYLKIIEPIVRKRETAGTSYER